MFETGDFPKYEKDRLTQFVTDLRFSVFKHQNDVAVSFNLNHSTISRYENEITPPFGYLAGLAVMFAEKQGEIGVDVQGIHAIIIKELNIIRSHHYSHERSFTKWEDLQKIAKSYLAIHKKKSTSKSPIPDPSLNGIFLAPPLPPQGVIGRSEDLIEIAGLIKLDDESARDVPPIALRGMGGIGKTTLAIAIAHQESVSRRYPDGVLWTALGPKPTVRLLLEAWGRALNADLLPDHDETACQEHLRSVLYHRKALLIVDDIWDARQGKYFLVGGPNCRTILTTRELKIAIALVLTENTRRIDVLKPAPAFDLLTRLAPAVRSIDRKAIDRLCERLEYLPLGLTLAGKLLAVEADIPSRMQRIVDELIERGESRMDLVQMEPRLGIDEERPVSIRAILGLSVDRLSKLDQDRFAMLSPFGPEPLTWEAEPVSNVWECSIEDAEATISRLIQRGIVEARGNQYWMHALLVDYAKQLRIERDL